MSGLRVPRQICSLSPPPPRTPARADPQVPHDARLGPSLWGKIGALYVYDDAGDALYGFNDLEVSVQAIGADRARFEIYAIADGYQKGFEGGAAFRVRIGSAEGRIAEFVWRPRAIAEGCADPVGFQQEFALAGAALGELRTVEIEGS